MMLLKQFNDRIISKNFWPPRSPPISFSCYLKEAYKNNLRIFVDLKRNIEKIIKNDLIIKSLLKHFFIYSGTYIDE